MSRCVANPFDPAGPLEVWRGAVPAAACDADGRAGLAAHLDIAMQGLAGLAAELGLDAPFSSNALARLRLRRAEIRVLAAARAGDALTGAAVLDRARVDGMAARIAHEAGGEAAAALLLDIDHVSARTGSPFAWPQRVARRIGAPAPDETAAPDRTRAGAPSGDVLGRGVFPPQAADAAGDVRPAEMLARLAEAAGAGGAASCTLRLHAAPRPGWPWRILSDPEDSTRTLWMADAASGAALAAVTFEDES